MLTSEHLCNLEGVSDEFASVQADCKGKGNTAIHLIQSWSPKESAKLTKEQIHAMGIQMAERFAPGHQFVVQTHDDQPHLHNHIMINPVHLETGKRIQNKIKNRHIAMSINDDIARENGLEVIPPKDKSQTRGPSDKAKRIETYRGRSYILDLNRKAQLARDHATNFDEYLSVLGSFDIKARVEKENITYFYPGHSKGKRGRNLDPRLDIPGLEAKFNENRARIQSVGGLVSPSGGAPTQNSNDKRPITARRDSEFTEVRPEYIGLARIPIDALNQAKTKSILDYCDKNKIPLTRKEDGAFVVTGKENIEVSEYSWKNAKNQTQGTVIDFVANHKRITLLKAVSELTNNPRLSLLEAYQKPSEGNYQPFYLSDQKHATRPRAEKFLSELIQSHGRTASYDDLFRRQAVSVSDQGVIRFFSERKSGQFSEYVRGPTGGYTRTRTGAKAPFISPARHRSHIDVFLSPVSYLNSKNARKDSSLVLLEPDLEAIHRTVATQPALKSISVVQEGDHDPDTQTLVERLRDTLNPFSIDITLTWAPSNLSLGRTQGNDVPVRDIFPK